MPDKFREFGDLWQRLNPQATVHDWTEEEIMDSEWINYKVLQKMYSESQQPGADLIAYYTHVMDVIGYEMVFKFGGWYFNCDLKPLKSLSMLNAVRTSFAMEDDVWPVNMAMFAYAPRNDIFEQIINELPKRYFGNPGAFMNFSTGCQLIKPIIDQNIDRITLFPRNVFNPIHFTDFNYGQEPDTGKDFSPETVAVHLWGHRTNQRNQRILESGW